MVFHFLIGALVTISTVAIVATTFTAVIDDCLAVSIGSKALFVGLSVSIGFFLHTCFSPSVIYTENNSEL